MKKIISVALAIIMILLYVPTDVLHINAQATQTDVRIWGGLDSAAGAGTFTKGDGTADNPYIIENGDQLYKMVYNFGTTDGKLKGTMGYYKLGCDIYLNDISNYDSWGKSGFDMSSLNNWTEFEDTFCHRTFYGNLNGDGYTIYGLYSHSYRIASFLPNVGHGAVIRNVNFKNSYIVNTSDVNANDQENDGESVGEKMWYAGAFGAAGVILSRADSAGDSDYNTVDFTINNCSITSAYVEAKYFTSAFVAAANSCQPYFANCMTADITLNSTSATQGVEGAIFNMPYGSTNPTAKMDNVLAVGYQIYGAQRDEMWSGKKIPTVSHTYTFKNVYSTVSNKYTINHSSYGSLSYTDSEVTVIDESKLIGNNAETAIPGFDWVYTWRAVEGGYPVPMREYVEPSGKEYYENGGPKYATDTWNGTAATHFAAGDGSLEDPYLIANCEEFYRMVTMPEKDAFYKIANGVTDLYFNDIEGKSYSTLMTYFSWGIGENYAYDEGLCFSGSFDGNGVVFHGVYSKGSNYAGLFSQVGSATLSNFTIRYSYINANASSAKGAGAVVGYVIENSAVNLKNIAVIDCNVISKTAAAGFVGNAGNNSKIYINNCILADGKISSSASPACQAAFLSNGDGCSATVRSCISLGTYPSSVAAASYSAEYLSVYTDTSAPSDTVADATESVNIVNYSSLLGEQAKTTCSDFNWDVSWKTTDSIPIPLNQQNNNGTVGSTWSGEIALTFAGGDGTKGNPYQVNTPEMLARMLVYGQSGAYYKLTANIYINDTSKSDWTSGAYKWYTSNDVSAFEGSFDGNGYSIYGLYAKAELQNQYAALIPVLGTESQIKKVKLYDSYFTGVAGSYLGGIAGVLEDNAAVASTIDACLIDGSVVFEGQAAVGGIAAQVGFSRMIIENCAFRGDIRSTGAAYGICENSFGKAEIHECISMNVAPFTASDKIFARNVYTNTQSAENGVITLDTDNMMGIGARNYMKALDFTSSWRLTSNNTPEPLGNTKSYNGVKGEVWSGKTASSFASGKGTKDNPYIIETGEQLALMITKAGNYADKYFKLGCDIYLNDVNGELWQNKSGAINWINSREAGYFSGHIDGDGYVVFGMHYSYKSTPSSSYLGLIPRLSGSATVENLGVSEAYTKVDKNDTSIYAGGIFGMGSAIYDFYGNKIGVSETAGDEFLIPGQATPTKLPAIVNCFVDHTCYIEATSVGGIGCAGGAAIVIRDCYVTASLIGQSDTKEGSLLGANWANCSRIYNSFALPQTDNKVIGGNQQWVDSSAAVCTYTENVYYYGNKAIYGTMRIKRPQWRIGEAAKENMPTLDWENTWRVEADGTPVLRVFDKQNRGAEQFSDKYFVVPDVTLSFDTNADDVVVEELVGKPYEAVNLPTPKRDGYKFVAWHAYEDLTLEYPYEYFIARDLTLYAEWEEMSVTQNFENYPYTMWDCDTGVWRYNTPDNLLEYNENYVHDGEKSVQLLSSSTDVQTLLLNYRKTLTPGQSYTVSFWTACGYEEYNPQLAISHKVYPDYIAADKLIEPITQKAQTVGEWTQYKYTFVAQTPWVALKVLDGDGVYFDDFVISTNGELISQTETSTDVAEAEFYGSFYDSAVLSSGVTKVGEFAFAYNGFITDIYIADSVTQIDQYAFYDCERLTDVWYAGSEEDFNKLVISENNKPLLDAVWHFDSCKIGAEHQYDGITDSDCNVCGEIRYVENVVPGDANGDGTVNGRDYGVLMQYLNEWDVNIDVAAADVNGDGKINGRDYGLLMQYLNDWDVELK